MKMLCRITDERVDNDPLDRPDVTYGEFLTAFDELLEKMPPNEKFEAITDMTTKSKAILFQLIDGQRDKDVGELIRLNVKHYWLNCQDLIDKAWEKASADARNREEFIDCIGGHCDDDDEY